MRAIVSLARPDGTFYEVGMSNRTIIDGTERVILGRAADYARGKAHRIEFYPPSDIQRDPIKVVIVKQ